MTINQKGENEMRYKTRFLAVAVLAAAAAFLLAGPGGFSVQAQSPLVHFVSAGGPDIADPDFPGSGPGFDKNFSLVAFKYSDGTSAGVLVDRWSGGPGLGLRAQIDCVHVVGNTAWMTGVVTQGNTLDLYGNVVSLAGYYVRTRVQDNGDNTDPLNPDKIAFAITRASAPFVCTAMLGGLFDMPAGQVIVR
jgi:hypothetical protein